MCVFALCIIIVDVAVGWELQALLIFSHDQWRPLVAFLFYFIFA